MSTVRLPKVEPEFVNDAIVSAAKGSPAFADRSAANNTQFGAFPFANRTWIASSRRERQASAAAALAACVASLGSVVALFASLS